MTQNTHLSGKGFNSNILRMFTLLTVPDLRMVFRVKEFPCAAARWPGVLPLWSLALRFTLLLARP
ncbi:hypothetical protein DPMN_193357 [Dreissena polymorpha]|uniref:Uncharacterized protein n=1 Tax=Dreissena polymorpha TaxID=45954 RepID=A0A9D3Y5L7_DREPO|nr:hypothetical protein DPMN_193357 [Dreissena polymorpha]